MGPIQTLPEARKLTQSSIPKTVSPFVRAIIEEYQKDAGIVGEEANIGSTFFIFCTKDFNRDLRLHEAIVNLSGAGKTTLVENVLKPFREFRKEDIIDVVRFTGAALERSESLDGKILLLSQAVGEEPTSIRPLLSEGKLGLMVVERREGSNQFESKTYEVDGMPCFVTTSTDPNIDPELLRRVVQRTVDESTEQTKRIKVKQALNVSTIRFSNLSTFRFTSAILRKISEERPKNVEQVVIPFGKEIEALLPDDLEIRSKLPQFFKLIQSIALVKALCCNGYHIAHSETSKTTQRIVIAAVEDFTDALFLAGASFFHLLPATAQAILDFLSSEISKEKIEEYRKCTIREIQVKLKLNASTIAKYANQLADKGLITKEKILNDRKSEVNLYQFNAGTIRDTSLQLKGFDNKAWIKSETNDQKITLTQLPLENALELKVLVPETVLPYISSTHDSEVNPAKSERELDVSGQKRATSESCVNLGKTPTITHESEVPHFQPENNIPPGKSPRYLCNQCDTDVGTEEGLKEHVRGHKLGLV